MCPIFLFLPRKVSKVALFTYVQCSYDSHNLSNQGGALQSDLESADHIYLGERNRCEFDISKDDTFKLFVAETCVRES